MYGFVHERQRDGLEMGRGGRSDANTRQPSAKVNGLAGPPAETVETAVVRLITQRRQVANGQARATEQRWSGRPYSNDRTCLRVVSIRDGE